MSARAFLWAALGGGLKVSSAGMEWTKRSSEIAFSLMGFKFVTIFFVLFFFLACRRCRFYLGGFHIWRRQNFGGFVRLPPFCPQNQYWLSANLRHFLLPPLCGRHIWKPTYPSSSSSLSFFSAQKEFLPHAQFPCSLERNAVEEEKRGME